MSILSVFKENNYFKVGLEFLRELFPNDVHLESCYYGLTFENTYRMLKYDLEKEINVIYKEYEYVSRFISLNQEGKVEGICIVCYIPQFKQFINYEYYIIIVAQTLECFSELMNNVPKNGRGELITFRDIERTFIRIKGGITEVHFWEIYLVKGKYENVAFEEATKEHMRLINKGEWNSLDKFERYIVFRESDLMNYFTFIMPNKQGIPIAFCALIPYTNNIFELKIYFRMYLNNEEIYRLYLFIRRAIYEVMGEGGNAIIRVKNKDQILRKLLALSDLKCISQEEHYHLDL